MLKRLLLIAYLGGMGTFSGLFGCECIPPQNAQEAIAEANLIFVGKCIQSETNWMSGGWKFSFEVKETWKKGADRFMIINTGWEEQDCGYIFEKDSTYLVYAVKKFTLKTDQCKGNKLLSEAKEDLQLLGQGDPPRQSSMVTMMYWTIGILGAISILFVAAIVLRKRKTPNNR